jgi:hypothetical protein
VNEHARRRAHQADVLRAERDRTEALLADALELAAKLAAAAGYATSETAILEMLAARRGFRLEQPSYVEQRELRAVASCHDATCLEPRVA